MRESRSRILVIDDDELTLEAFRRMLGKEANVTAVNTAELAVKTAAKNHFAVVLTDLVMPGMNGFELIELLSQISPASICVVLTGRIEEPFPKGRPSNVFTCLHKPCEIDQLVRTLHAALAEYVLRSLNQMKSYPAQLGETSAD
jgi:DNA-binding NtrC family response regulator